MNKIKIALFSVILLSLSCEKQGTDPLFEDIPVVEGYIQPDQPLLISISRQLPFSDYAEYKDIDIDNLDVSVSSQGENYALQPIGNGQYVDSTLAVIANESYALSFQFGDDIITAETTIPSKPIDFDQSATSLVVEQFEPGSGPPGEQSDPIELTWSSFDDSYYLIVVENIEDVPESTFDFGDDAPPERVFRDEPLQGNSYDLNGRNFNYYGTHRIVLFHLNDDYAALYDDAETTSINLTTPTTSIENGVGLFTGINSDTLYIEITN